jgi:hypothetical protein
MALYDITADASAVIGTNPSKVRLVQNPTASSVTAPAINPGEPVAATLGSNYATSLATSKPVVATDFLFGISEDYSTESGGNDGIVHVQPIDQKAIYLCNATTPANIATQALYNALIGHRVLFTKSAANNTGKYTVGTSDSSTSGLVIEYNDIIANPGKIAFSFREGLAYNY